MADICQGEGVILLAGKVNHIVAVDGDGLVAVSVHGGGFAGNVGQIANLPLGSGDPIPDHTHNGAVQHVGGSGAGGGGFCLGIHIQSSDGGIQGLHGGDVLGGQQLSGFLGSGNGSGLFLVGVGGDTGLIGSTADQELAGRQVVVMIGVGGVQVVIFRFLGPQVSILIGQACSIVGIVAVGQGSGLQVLPVAVHGGTLAEQGLQVILTLFVAREHSVGLHGGQVGLDLSQLFLGQGIAIGFGFLGQGNGSLGIGDSAGLEIISPGAAGFLIGDLLIQRGGHIQTEHGGMGAIVVVEFVDSVDEVVVQLGIA